jgi:KaiC/GvpD/RAD55 family RecA-like ATPase
MTEEQGHQELCANQDQSEAAEVHSNDPSTRVTYKHYSFADAPKVDGKHVLKVPTAGELLMARFKDRRHLLFPWLREQENCMVYAATGIGKSLFALSAAMAVAGNGDYLGWKPDAAPHGSWRVLYVDGEMHIADIQERLQQLRDGMPGLDKVALDGHLRFLARQHQDAGVQFPSITEYAGQQFVLQYLQAGKFDLVVLDNFSTLGEVEDENAAASFNAIQQFLLQLKVLGVATILVHHTGKAEDNFRGSSKLAATFETIIQLERPEVAHKNNAAWKVRTVTAEPGGARFRVKWDKVRSGATQPRGRIAVLEKQQPKEFDGIAPATWDYAETQTTDKLDELAQLLPDGVFRTKAEIAIYYDVSPTMADKYIKQGLRYGLWTEENISRWLANGKKLRTQGQTQAPVRPDSSWKNESPEVAVADAADGGYKF